MKTHKDIEYMRPVIDIKDAVKAVFESGNGILMIDPRRPDALIASMLRQALSFGKPFKVIPITGETLSNHGASAHSEECGNQAPKSAPDQGN